MINLITNILENFWFFLLFFTFFYFLFFLLLNEFIFIFHFFNKNQTKISLLYFFKYEYFSIINKKLIITFIL